MKPALFLLLAILQSSVLSQTPTGTIAGVFRGVDGAPAANVRISAMEVPEQDGSNVAPTVAGFGQTDASGRYRIEGLRPGRYFILAGPLDSPTYYPGVAQRLTATPVSVVAGASLDTLSFSLSEATQNGIIQVLVQHAGDTTPVEGASITISLRSPGSFGSQNSINGKTDANGQWTIGGLAPGQYSIQAEREGLVGNSIRGRTQMWVSAQVTLTADQNESRVVLPMATGATIEGRVQTADGQPIRPARIQLLQMGYQDGRRALVTAGNALVTIDANGFFKLTSGPGQHYLQVTSRIQTRGNAQQPVQIAYYPGVTAIPDAKLLTVANGEKLTANITIPNQHGYTISGTVTNPLPGRSSTASGGVTRAISTLILVPRNTDVLEDSVSMQYANTANANLQGSGNSSESPFEIRGIPAGDYDLYPIFIDTTATRNILSTARTPVTIRDKDITNLSITLRPNVVLKGRFVVEGNVRSPALDSVRVQLRPKDTLPIPLQSQIAVQLEPNYQSFTATNLTGSVFDIVVNGLPTNVYVADIRQGNRSVLATGVDTRNGAVEPVDIVLRSDVGSITGAVRSTGTQAPVLLIRPAKLTQVRQFYRLTPVGSNGQFSVEGVAPGDYVVYAFSAVPAGGAEQNDDFMKQYESQGRPVTVTASKATRVELTMIEDDSLIPVTPSPALLPQISNRVIRSADTPISRAGDTATAPARGFRGGAVAAARGATPVPVPANARGAAPAVSPEIERNLAMNPTTPAERTQLLAFLQVNGRQLINSDRITAERLFRKGQEMEPNNPRWASQLGEVYGLSAKFPSISPFPMTAAEAGKRSVEEYEKALVLGQNAVLPAMAESARIANMTDKAIEYAERAVATGNADSVHNGYLTLGLIAVGKGDIANAKKYLLASGNVPTTPVLGSFGPGMNLANELLGKGERETVIAYLEECLKFWTSGEDRLKEWISTLKSGRTPQFGANASR